ncbi:hypothetical protein OIE69_40940 [Actinacidiphila glaucinigra]|uniref:hypothetical protein n=1 Tax=Actinacidiphila glaucinigra TaxID=235986 RepID=UPI002DD963B0|nr:hypothetical protein [Actinacidiphila glaucinigra]WSD64814.1 hypothetical protein OIE69_40940 [Actinacidiphila glaucinigra]
MSNSYARPILRTEDLSMALRVVQDLLELADTVGMEVDFEAIAHTPQELARILHIAPGAEWWSYGPGRAVRSGEGKLVAADHLPVYLSDWCREPSEVDVFLAAAGSAPAIVRWDFNAWPAAPEAGLGPGGSRGAYVTLTVNSHNLYLDEPGGLHTVFVHVKQFEAERAPWLAKQVGQEVIGPLTMAPV